MHHPSLHFLFANLRHSNPTTWEHMLSYLSGKLSLPSNHLFLSFQAHEDPMHEFIQDKKKAERQSRSVIFELKV